MIIGKREIIFKDVKNGFIPIVKEDLKTREIKLLLTEDETDSSLKHLLKINLSTLEELPFESFCLVYSGAIRVAFCDD